MVKRSTLTSLREALERAEAAPPAPVTKRPAPAGPVRLVVVIESRDHCPCRRRPADLEEHGWGPQVPTCHHPRRREIDADSWCPSAPDQRPDEPRSAWRYAHSTWRPRDPFPPGCPLVLSTEVDLRKLER